MTDDLALDAIAEPPASRVRIHAKRLREVLHYNPETGAFTWIEPPWNHPRMRGIPAGCSATGYIMIKVDGRAYKAHRLAWLYVHGVWPSRDLDHRDGDPLNNAIDNLRECTMAQNIANARIREGKLLPKGVRRNASGRFSARISHRGRLITIGSFATPEAASAAYLTHARALYGDFARAG